MVTSYTIGSFIGEYPTTKFRRKDFIPLAALSDLDDLVPGFDLKTIATRLATGRKTIKSTRQDIYDHDGLPNEDIANYMVLALTRILKEVGETSPQMVNKLSPETVDRSDDYSRETARILSEKEMILSNGRRIRIVKQNFSSKDIIEHGSGWYLEVVGEDEKFDQILIGGHCSIHGG